MPKNYTVICITVFCIFFLTFPDSSFAQRKRQSVRKSTVSKPAITLTKIYKDIVGKSVEGVMWEETEDNPKTWSFGSNETREIEILKSEIGKENAAITIKMLTQDATPNKDGLWMSLRGNLRLQYERIAGGWLLTKIENISFKYVVRNSNGESVDPNELNGIETQSTISQSNSQVISQNTTQSVTKNILLVNNTFTIAPGKFQYFQFNVTGRAIVTGRFRAQGGNRNDIKVYVVSQDGFENLKNGNNTPTFYNSGQATVGTIYTVLGTGNYYLIFDNSFSIFSNKAVTANVELRY